MSLLGGRGPAFHIELESLQPVYHKRPVQHATTPGYTETDPSELGKIGAGGPSASQIPNGGPAIPGALGTSSPPSPLSRSEEEAVSSIPSVNK